MEREADGGQDRSDVQELRPIEISIPLSPGAGTETHTVPLPAAYRALTALNASPAHELRVTAAGQRGDAPLFAVPPRGAASAPLPLAAGPRVVTLSAVRVRPAAAGEAAGLITVVALLEDAPAALSGGPLAAADLAGVPRALSALTTEDGTLVSAPDTIPLLASAAVMWRRVGTAHRPVEVSRSGELYPLTSRTASPAPVTGSAARSARAALWVFLDVTVAPGAETLQLWLEHDADAIFGLNYRFAQFAPVSGTGRHLFCVAPGASATHAVPGLQVQSLPVPSLAIRYGLTHSAAGAWSYRASLLIQDSP